MISLKQMACLGSSFGMLLFPPNFDELLLCVSLHLGLEGAEGAADVRVYIPEEARAATAGNRRCSDTGNQPRRLRDAGPAPIRSKAV